MACETEFSTGISATGAITCKRADTFSLKLAVTHEDDSTPHDLTVYSSLIMNVKVAAKDSTYILQFKTSDGTIVVYDTNKLELKQTATIMKLIAGAFVYDVEAITGVIVSTLFGGSFTIIEDVTRDGDSLAP